jgi:hypothetical protein
VSDTQEDCPLAPPPDSPFHRHSAPGYHTVGADRVCNYCGSWHADEFVAWCERVLRGEETPFREVKSPLGEHAYSRLTLNDHCNKLYVHRDGISNAGEGAIKVRTIHLTREQIDLVNRTLSFCNEATRATGKSC